MPTIALSLVQAIRIARATTDAAWGQAVILDALEFEERAAADADGAALYPTDRKSHGTLLDEPERD